jgi:hypothetical protein
MVVAFKEDPASEAERGREPIDTSEFAAIKKFPITAKELLWTPKVHARSLMSAPL